MVDSATFTCRGCLRELKGFAQYSFLNPEIKELFVQCTSIDIPPDEQGLPQQICSECYSSCDRWFSFRNMCLDANNQLQRKEAVSPVFLILNSDHDCLVSIKEEEMDIEDSIPNPGLNPEEPCEAQFVDPVEVTPDLSPIVLIERLDPQWFNLVPETITVINPFDNYSASDQDILDDYGSEEDSSNCMEEILQAATWNRLINDRRATQCPICKLCWDDLHSHIFDTHVEKNSTICPLCEKQFNHIQGVREHIRQVHLRQRQMCPICYKYGFAIDLHIMNTHVNKHEIEPPCPICQEIPALLTLRQHLDTHLGGKRIECPICNRGFPVKRDLAAHISTAHKDSSDLKTCPICKVKTVDPVFHIIKRHMRTESLTCPICDQIMSTTAQIPKHLHSHFTTQCPKCCKTFLKLDQLRKHFVSAHRWSRKKEKCPVCKSMRFHMFTHLHDRHSNDGTNTCLICDKTFVDRNLAVLHYFSHMGIMYQKMFLRKPSVL